MAHVMHLNKSGKGIASKTACGRYAPNTPFAGNWETFKSTTMQRCEKCEASKQAALNMKADANKWVPVEDPNAWKEADAKLIAAARH